MGPKTLHSFKRIGLVLFGGIGDAVLFSPVIKEIRSTLQKAHSEAKLIGFLEDRTCSVAAILPPLDDVIPLKIQGKKRSQVFFQLVTALKKARLDAVICAGSTPFIPFMLLASGVPYRVGYHTGAVSRALMTTTAPLNKKGYAAEMYYALADSFLTAVAEEHYQPPAPVIPSLRALAPEEKKHFIERSGLSVLAKGSASGPVILIHPGFSKASVAKRILKAWPAAQWANLLGKIFYETSATVILAGGPDDEETVSEILTTLQKQGILPNPRFMNAYGKTTSLTDLAVLIDCADMLVCVDSSPLHLAIALNKPSVALFGPTNPNKLLPKNSSQFKAVVQETLTCRPCLWETRLTSCEQPLCLEVSAEKMFAAICQLLPETGVSQTSLAPSSV